VLFYSAKPFFCVENWELGICHNCLALCNCRRLLSDSFFAMVLYVGKCPTGYRLGFRCGFGCSQRCRYSCGSCKPVSRGKRLRNLVESGGVFDFLQIGKRRTIRRSENAEKAEKARRSDGPSSSANGPLNWIQISMQFCISKRIIAACQLTSQRAKSLILVFSLGISTKPIELWAIRAFDVPPVLAFSQLFGLGRPPLCPDVHHFANLPLNLNCNWITQNGSAKEKGHQCTGGNRND